MKRVADIAGVVIKAILIVSAILLLGRFFGLRVRDAGGNIAAKACVSVAQST